MANLIGTAWTVALKWAKPWRYNIAGSGQRDTVLLANTRRQAEQWMMQIRNGEWGYERHVDWALLRVGIQLGHHDGARGWFVAFGDIAASLRRWQRGSVLRNYELAQDPEIGSLSDPLPVEVYLSIGDAKNEAKHTIERNQQDAIKRGDEDMESEAADAIRILKAWGDSPPSPVAITLIPVKSNFIPDPKELRRLHPRLPHRFDELQRLIEERKCDDALRLIKTIRTNIASSALTKE